MDNDYLRVNSKSDDAEIVTSEYDVTKETTKTEEQSKLTVMSILFSGKKKHGRLSSSVQLPTFKGAFTIFIVLSFISVFVLFIALISKTAELFIFDAFLISLLFPIAAITLFNDLNTQKKISVSEMICAVVTGAFAYLLINFVNDYLLELMSDVKTLAEIITLILSDAFLFVLAFVYIKLMKKDDMFATISVCICIYGGYLVMHTAMILMTSLCVNVSVIGGEVRAIIFDGNSNEFGRSANAFVKNILSEGLYYPLLVICWATICAGVIGLTALPFREVKEHRVTYALFLLIQIVLHVVSNFTSTLRFYNVLISSVCLIFSLFCALRMLNYALSKSNLLREDKNVSE